MLHPIRIARPPSSAGSITTLRELVLKLLCEVQCIGEANALTIENGFDFYDEVSRFEIDLIRRALLQTGGHQVRAAKLLNLKVTTLNSKIKHYNIIPTGFTNLYPLAEPAQHPGASARIEMGSTTYSITQSLPGLGDFFYGHRITPSGHPPPHPQTKI